jgi:cyclase
MRIVSYVVAAAAGLLLAAAAADKNAHSGSGEPDFSKVQMKSTQVSGNVWMMEGMGGNIGVLAGDDGLLVIDDQFAPLAQKIQAALKEISLKPVRFLFNTHWHGDHTGGNLAMAEAGAIIVAQDNVRKRLSTEQVIALHGGRKVPAAPAKAWPVVTLDDEIEFHLNGEDVRVLYVPAAHTDGDCIVHFPKADVIHTGDVFTAGFPILDYGSGGTLDGYIQAEEKVLSLAGPSTKIIPGHGGVADKAAVQAKHDATVKLRDRIVAMIDQGKTLAQIKAAKPTAEVDAKWTTDFVKPDLFVEMAYNGYLAEKKGGGAAK